MEVSVLAEWLAQTKKISKSADYLCMSAIDSVMEVIDWIDKKTILGYADFFNYFCKKYHKPNPVDAVSRRRKAKSPCEEISKFARNTIKRCEVLQEDVEFQWFEIIDFLFEQPHLVNPHSIDEYTANMINFVCRKNKKNNPLKSDIRNKFGKMYRGEDGAWHKERRKRF